MKGSNGGSETSFTGGRRDSCLAKIQKLEQDRANRRNKLEKARADRVAEEARNIANGNPGDVDFMGMIKAFRNERAGFALPHVPSGNDMKICIAIRKRPTNSKERARKDHDAVSCFNPEVTVHDCKLKVDGISKYLDSVGFRFDQAFGEEVDNQLVYDCTAKPLVPFVLNHGRATVFAYGQTGSGKTYTMLGIQQNATADLFEHLEEMPGGDSLCVFVSFFEIYGGHCQDLLNGRNRVVVREDGKGEVVIAGLEEKEAMNAEGLEELIADGNRNRTTHATESNDQSSRSHAICQISIRNISTGRLHGKLSLIDLAGSERGADTKSHDRQRRVEGAEINKSLLALKECIRALDSDSVHVPYRASKLTLVLKDSFTRKGARTVMIATVSPGASSADHTINTLRYADRVKENKVEQFRPGANRGSPPRSPTTAAVEDVCSSSPPDQSPLPASSSRSASPLAAAADDDGGVGEGGLISQRRQNDRRRGGGIWSETASGAGTGRAGAGLHRRVASGLRSTGAGDSDGGVSLDLGHPQSKAAPNVGRGGMRMGTPTRRGSSFSSFRRSSSISDGSKRCPGSPAADPAASLHPSLETPLDHGGQGSLRSSRLVLGKGRGEGGRMRVVGRLGDLAKEGKRLYASPSPERGESVGGRRDGTNMKSADLDIIDPDDDYKPEYVPQSHLMEESEERTLLLFNPAMDSLSDEEDALMHMHMDIIEENTKLLAEEGLLLQAIERKGVNQREMDRYVNRLSEIVNRKMTLMSTVRDRFRSYVDYLETDQYLTENT